MRNSLHASFSIASTLKCITAGMLALLTVNVNAQIISSDTVDVGETVSFDLSGTDKFNTYAWEFGTTTFKTLLTTSVAIPNTGTSGNQFDVAACASMIYDNATKSYYGFVTSASSGFTNPSVQRINFGANPNNMNPVVVNLGNPGNAFISNTGGYHNMEDFKVVRDDAGVYHAFINNGGVVHWVFGNGIGQAPTQATRIFTNSSVLGMSINMAVIKYNNSWYIFTGQAFGTQPGLVRLDLGADLNAIPANIPYNAFPAVANLDNISYLAVLKESANWYITMIAGDGNATMVRYSFGTDLLNNSPAIVNLGASNTAFLRNRGLNYLKTCDSTALVGIFEDGSIYKYNYSNNSITNAPIPNDLGQKFGSSVAMQTLAPYWYKDTLWALTSSFTNNATNTVYRFPMACFNSNGNTSVNYYSSAASHTFNTAGIYDVEVYCDQGDNRGPQSFCKQIVVVNPTATEDVVASKGSVAVYPNPATDELNIKIPSDGKYTYNVCNTLGRVVFSASGRQMLANDVIRLDLKNYAISPGIYYLNLTASNGERYTAKFVKR